MNRTLATVALAATLAVTAAAQSVTVGRLYPQGGGGSPFAGDATPFSFVDFMHPATANGVLTHAIVRWSAPPTPPCTNAFKLKFLRPFGSTSTYSLVDERGPFNASGGRNEITIDSVAVQRGDVIALTQLRAPSECGNLIVTRVSEAALQAGNIEVGSGRNDLGVIPGYSPAIFASADVTAVVGILPVAGATQGNFGSFFRTAVQLTGSDSSPVTGKIVFHPAGNIPSSGDPSIPFNLALNQTVSFSDIVTSMGRSGLGSMDVVTSGMPPVLTARVYNDGGFSGTSGFTEEAFAPTAALQNFQTAYLSMPSDVENYRMNVGVRSLGSQTTLSIGRFSASGALLAAPNVVKTYPPNYFEQVSGAAFAGLTALSPDGVLTVQVIEGQAIVYATITDNRTNDSSIVFAVPTR
jgi:hypothetical protein